MVPSEERRVHIEATDATWYSQLDDAPVVTFHKHRDGRRRLGTTVAIRLRIKAGLRTDSPAARAHAGRVCGWLNGDSNAGH